MTSLALGKLVREAPIEYFRPRIILLDLERVANRRGVDVDTVLQECRDNATKMVSKSPGQALQPTEYLITDIHVDEHMVIIDG
jgi:hypothetical protein